MIYKKLIWVSATCCSTVINRGLQCEIMWYICNNQSKHNFIRVSGPGRAAGPVCVTDCVLLKQTTFDLDICCDDSPLHYLGWIKLLTFNSINVKKVLWRFSASFKFFIFTFKNVGRWHANIIKEQIKCFLLLCSPKQCKICDNASCNLVVTLYVRSGYVVSK